MTGLEIESHNHLVARADSFFRYRWQASLNPDYRDVHVGGERSNGVIVDR